MRATVLAAVLSVALAPAATAQERRSVANARPSVVRTEPPAGDTTVDPIMTVEIKVTFSKEMMDGSWSWCKADEGEFPALIGKPKYLPDKKTCVINVKLKPGTTYAIWVNTGRFRNFKDKNGRAAVPYLLVFETE